jgi:hypothetical protein
MMRVASPLLALFLLTSAATAYAEWSTSSDHVLLGERGVEQIMYRCLPDSVDPRGPKAK